MIHQTTPKDKPKWYNIRRRVASKLVILARKIYPDSLEVKAFWMDVMMDSAIYGKAITRVNPEAWMKEEDE
jgi:hypothetical protein